jgi:Sigma-70 factor, region 1.2
MKKTKSGKSFAVFEVVGLDPVGIVTPFPPTRNQGDEVAKDRIDRDEEDLVRLYLTDIGQYALLTKDDEVRLAISLQTVAASCAKISAMAQRPSVSSCNPTCVSLFQSPKNIRHRVCHCST